MRRRLIGAALGAIALLCWSPAADADDVVRHELRIGIEPATHRLSVTDRVTLPEQPDAGDVEFLLDAALTIRESDPPVRRVPLGDVERFLGINAGAAAPGTLELARYRIDSPDGSGSLTLRYDGVVDHALSDPGEEYARSFRETAGTIGTEGIYLAGETYWYPVFGDNMVEFRLDANVPEGWHLISQGDGTSRGEDGRAVWSSGGPMDEIYLCGGPLHIHRRAAGAVEALVYLRRPDDALAARYLEATARYLEMYRGLIGPYPYGKFALVENFWETGYGMPSFTLLGSTVIRLPFILHSSYPHEILHNWWGNSVFVDYASGNWCEGLTAYMADHLIQEQRGKGSDYRRSTLQKYRSYVSRERDFPLAEFRSRHSAATEAVGYGKSLMGFHMLRRRLGDERFRDALARFYREQRGKRASFRDLQRAFERVAGEELDWFFDPWILRAGAASLAVTVDAVRETEGGYRVEGRLRQVQGGDPFPLDVPVALQTARGLVTEIVRLDAAERSFEIRLNDPPLLLRVDPRFDLFRLLDPREVPPSIGQIFGEPRILAVLPSTAPPERREAYRKLLDAWRSESHSIESKLDSELPELPADRAIWVAGRENRYAEVLFGDGSTPGLERFGDGVALGGERVVFDDRSLVVVRRHPGNLEKAVGWLVVDPPEAFPGLARKLPHYGKYSYLAFEGSEPTNVLKGQWPATSSPLLVDLRDADRRDEPPPALPAEARSALAELPPVFSEQAMADHVTRLASPALEGRGLGSEGLSAAADYVADRFREAGLSPGGDNAGWFQSFDVPEGPDGEPVEARNVIGYLPAAREDWKNQSVVLGAHYDHLGRGWPDVHSGDEGRIHPGADDNASGVAVMLELARNLAEGEAPSRNLIFVAFTGEEAGRLGSRRFVEHPGPFPLEGVRAMINLDTVGRLDDGPISVLGTATADEWPHIFRGCSYVTGVESRNVAEMLDASDQMSFIERGIPAVQLFTRAHADYHRPSDTPDRVDVSGLVKVATLAKEAVDYLVERAEPLTVRIAAVGAAKARAPGPSGGGRRVSFGVVPEFSYPGPGVRMDGVVADSPAEEAGLRAGDLLIAIDGAEIADLRGFSDVLKSLEPGQTVTATVRRGDETLEIPVTVRSR